MADAFAVVLPFLYSILNFLAPFIIVFVLFFIAKTIWHHYKQEKFVTGIEWVLLEIRVPRNIEKSPKAMEFILTNAMYQVTEKGFWEKWVLGAARLWFSMEIVSLGGQVHFFIRTPSRLKQLLVSQIYAQYPQVEVLEVEDYAFKVPDVSEESGWKMWGCEFALEKPDPYPIKTYVDWESGDKPDEAEELDPITSTIEYLGSIKSQEQLWIQIIVRGTQKKYHTPGTFNSHHEFGQEALEEVNRLVAPYSQHRVDDVTLTTIFEVRTPDPIKNKVEAIRKKTAKLAFDVGIRTVYIAPSQHFNVDTYKGLRMMFRQYNSYELNSIGRINSTQIDNPWEDPFGNTVLKMKNHLLHNYRLRNYFYPGLRESIHWWWPLSTVFPNHPPHPFVLNTEELATLFHLPGRISRTPSFKRLDSRKSEPPSNLPT